MSKFSPQTVTVQYEQDRGMKCVVKERTFKSGAALAKWLEKADGSVRVLRTEVAR